MGTLDYSDIAAAVALGTALTSIVAMGAVKITPNATRWIVNKLVSMFR